jgi:hypothetical protein
MEENKFEKQVQQKMDELKIHPSDSVWEKIEVRIEKKKPANRGLFLFVLLFCVFLTGSYLLWNTSHHSITGNNNSEKTNSAKNTNKISIKENTNGQAKTNSIPGSINQKNDAAGNAALKKSTNKNSSQQYKLSTTKRIIKINSGGKATIVLSKQQEVKEEISENTNIKPGIIKPVETQPENEKIRAEIEDFAYDKLNNDSLSKPSSLQDEKAEVMDTLKQILTSHETVKHSKRNKWKPGILFSGGISGVGNNFLGLDKSRAYDYSSSVGQGAPGTIPAITPSRTKSAFGFMAGVFAEKDISAKARLVLGINFISFNTSNNVGIRNDTTGSYNSRNTVNRYKNLYNFIELPVTLKSQVGRGKNIPLFWQGGFVISELISSSALQFNPISGYYYTNNSIFNKTQIGLNTSISVALFSKQKNSVLIGPYFYYGASGVANEGLYNKKHFVFTGLRTEIIFGK